MTPDIVTDANRLHSGIGKIVVHFQLIESVIAEVLASLLHMREPSDIHRVTAAMSYAQKLNLMCDLYEERKNPKWPLIDLKLTRNALTSAETFRNSVVHSLWFIGGENSEWIREKANLRNGGKLNVVTGPANIEALEEGARCLNEIRNWYLGCTDQLATATSALDELSRRLSVRQRQVPIQASEEPEQKGSGSERI